MQLILTHEQADFDALGASLGAYLMNERAIPVLPRRLNRNARAFITLYGPELPFFDFNDLPDEPIEAVTLVDTQSMATQRGISTKTPIQVVDHHPRRPDLPANWQVTVDVVGACTSLFVEGLSEHNGALNPIHATLMLIGIYEDTGSLVYAGTTSRDARAVSFLLEQGASLEIATRYLNPPLSADQRVIYDRILSACETHNLNGLDFVVAAIDAAQFTDEISSVAHKVRDLLDPPALFLLVHTVEGVRLIARSTTDSINVSAVAACFGGGGHGRAAAALVRVPSNGVLPYQADGETTLAAVRRELLRILPEHIRPTTTVRQIMSRHPLLLPPETPVDKAAQLIQRYGYEGFPVVKAGKVIGLLNRRAVDRAVAHKLNLTVSSLMETGQVSVQPGDSIEHLRDVMINSGWGQVPVVDPEKGQIVGIVTRTDLLKHITGYAPVPGRNNLASRLDAALPPTRLALLKAVAAQAVREHQAIYIVGGFVRDLLLDRPGLDFDLVVEGDAIALARALEKRYGGRVLSHHRFGTARWTIASIRDSLAAGLSDDKPLDPGQLPESLDLISARTEFYDYPTALPTVERSSIKLDLHRRDFTVNTMALRLDGHHYGDLYDYWGGLRDLRKGLVRVLHSLSFVDDPTRQLRAVRFEQRFNFKIEARTLELMDEGRPLMRSLSGDRLRHELNLILQEEKRTAMLSRLDELGLLSAIHPDLRWSEQIAQEVDQAWTSSPDTAWQLPEKIGNLPLRLALAYLLWLLPMPPDKAGSIANRIRLPGSLQEQLATASRLLQNIDTLPQLPPSRAAARLDSVPEPALYAVYLLLPDAPVKNTLFAYISGWKHVQAITNGDDLRILGVPPGPAYKDILTRLRAAWLDGEIRDAAGEQALLSSALNDINFK